MEGTSNFSVPHSEDLLLLRAQEVNATDKKDYFKILETIVVENYVLNTAHNISDLDETGFSVKQEAVGSYSRKKGSVVFSMSHVQGKVSK
jgi:hypothetical protein